jgi:hypothetical protein
MVIFNSYVKLPEGIYIHISIYIYIDMMRRDPENPPRQLYGSLPLWPGGVPTTIRSWAVFVQLQVVEVQFVIYVYYTVYGHAIQ